VKIRLRLDEDGWAGPAARQRYARTMRFGRVLLSCLAAAVLVNFATTAATPVKAPAKKLLKAAPPPLSADMRAAQALVRRMSIAEQAAQLVIVVCNGDVYSLKSPEYERYRHLVKDVHIGGLIVNNAVQYGLVRYAEPHSLAVFLNQMQRLAKTPLIVGSDFERSASMRVSGGARFPYNMAFGAAGDVDAVRYEGTVAAREARAVGVHWIFAPVADVNNNPDNPIINIRSYGEDPEQVARFVAAFIDGAHADPANRVLTTAKHFPGHGRRGGQPHGSAAPGCFARAPEQHRAETVPGRHRARRRLDYDRAHLRPCARSRGSAGHRIAPNPERSAAR